MVGKTIMYFKKVSASQDVMVFKDNTFVVLQAYGFGLNDIQISKEEFDPDVKSIDEVKSLFKSGLISGEKYFEMKQRLKNPESLVDELMGAVKRITDDYEDMKAQLKQYEKVD